MDALNANTSGSNNTAVGYYALYANISGTDNTAVGAEALYSNTTGANNTAVGYYALNANTSGINNTAIGFEALLDNTTGIGNTAVGYYALQVATAANYNTAIGMYSAAAATTGAQNTAVGYYALKSLTVGTTNTCVGSLAGSSYTGSEANNICIGYNVTGTAAESNVIRIGNASNASCFISGINGQTSSGGTAVYVNGSNQLGTATSSIRFKENIQNLGSESILGLRPVKFNYIADKSKATCYGMIAEEVEQVFPNLVVYQDGQPFSIKYHEMPALFLYEIKKLSSELEQLRDRFLRMQASLQAKGKF